MAIPLPLLNTPAPEVPLDHLDQLWFQVAGTVCNLTCHHCFISCSPHNDRFGFLSFEAFRTALDASVRLGVKEYYFTGGEPFLHRDIVPMIALALRHGPVTVLTNGTVLRDEWLAALQSAADSSPYSLEFRVSIDGPDAATNDPIRGAGTFDRAMTGVRRLVGAGFLPIITAAVMNDDSDSDDLFRRFVTVLVANRYHRPRVKLLPALRLGAEVNRSRGYQTHERVTPEMLASIGTGQLLCRHARIVTDRGVAVCPILIEAPDMYLGPILDESLKPASLRHNACWTCLHNGAICSNPTGFSVDTRR